MAAANIEMTSEQKWEWYRKVFSNLVHNQVEKITEKPLWYEVWIDLDETFERWFDYMYNYPNLAAYSLARWLIRRDNWYWSPSYVAELDKATEKCGDPAQALCNVLSNSLK